MKVPRNVDAADVINLLIRYDYNIVKQTGSHFIIGVNDPYENYVFKPPSCAFAG